MPISNFKAKTKTIDFDGGSIEVRALSTLEISFLCEGFASDFASLFDQAFQADPRKMLEDEGLIQRLMWLLIRRGPVLVGKIIALAADEPDKEAIAASLPIDVQLATLEQIINLTVPDPANLRQVMRSIGNHVSTKSTAIAGRRQ